MYDLRRRFVTEAVSTAGPATLLVMLMDRLTLDLDRAAGELEKGNRSEASPLLMHAQQIVDALRSSLDPTEWEGASDLNRLYGYIFSLLVTANVRGDLEVLNEVRELVAPLRAAWAEAAASPEAAGAFAPAAPTASRTAFAHASADSSGSLLGVG